MRLLTKCALSGFFSAAILLGQSLRVPSSRTDFKTPGVFSVTIDSPRGKEPVGLQWEFSVPPAIAIRMADITIGKAAVSAGKSITCATSAYKPVMPGGMKYACILAGGQKPIGNGPLVIVQYHAQVNVQGAPIRVGIENILGVSANSKPIAIPNVDAIIEIL
jgi:hypothetical protein